MISPRRKSLPNFEVIEPLDLSRQPHDLKEAIVEKMEEQEFRDRADAALSALYRRLSVAADEFDFEADFNAGALAIEFESPPGKFVVSPNSPVRQIWVSAHSKSYKLDWDSVQSAFVLSGTGQTLVDLVSEAIGKQLGEEVAL